MNQSKRNDWIYMGKRRVFPSKKYFRAPKVFGAFILLMCYTYAYENKGEFR